MKLNKILTGAAVALTFGLGTTAVVGVPAEASSISTVTPQSVAHDCYAKAIYGDGPGSGIFAKNYRAYDAYCDGNGRSGGTWFGPWRLKKSSAQNDAKAHNGYFG